MDDDGAPAGRVLGMDHVNLYVADLAATRRFYCGLLGFEEEPRPANLEFAGVFLRAASARVHVGVEFEPGRWAAIRPGWTDAELRVGRVVHFALQVDDVAAVLARLVDHGHRVVGGPRIRTDDVEQWYVHDPDRNVVELLQQLDPAHAARRRTELAGSAEEPRGDAPPRPA